MSQLARTEVVITTTAESPEERIKESIPKRKTIVYQTLVDPAVVRIAAEKNKKRLFKRFVFKIGKPQEIQLTSISKNYEPFIVVSGKYSIDYYRRAAYTVRLDKEVREVILLNNSFTPSGARNSTSLRLEGEERLLKETGAFLVFNRFGQQLGLDRVPTAPSEKQPEELMESFGMEEIPSTADVELIRSKIAQRPRDLHRTVSEVFQVDERSVIYVPRFKATYTCERLNKEVFLEFDGITGRLIKQDSNLMIALRAIFVLAEKALNLIKKQFVMARGE